MNEVIVDKTQSPVRLLVLEGDGIGAEICNATLAVLRAAERALGLSFAFETELIGFASLEKHGTTFHDDVEVVAKAVDGVILGPVSHMDYPPAAKGGLNPSGQLRKRLDLYANIRPAKSRPGFPPRCGSPIDLVVVRENTEGFYADRNMFVGSGEFMPTPDVALAVRKITREGSTRIVRSAFELARRRRNKVTAIHKANVLRVSDGLFVECARAVAKEYPDVAYDEKIIDAMAALLIRDASVFDVVVATNMFGDILSDEASEISGSLGLAASLNAGSQYAVAQAQHGSAPDIAGKGVANPSSLISSAAMLLSWLGERRGDPRLVKASELIEAALDEAIGAPEKRTRDLGGTAGTEAFAGHVAAAVERLAASGG
ncbi:isocitrate/isopropylmalate dehydrogenase family protein [Aquabacter sp. CN5-332]|uniref:isocitrate/isopropylmalate dehydrogenase family protein n=1 Tax=Aquabacter sp. CN5-332 TaxID=3156608 RepID=UPI0032B51076